MNIMKLVRWSGLAALVGGVLLIILTVVEILAYGDAAVTEAMTNSLWVPVNVFFLVGTAFLTLGLIGLYACQSEPAGVSGLVAFLVAFAGTILSFAFTWAGTFLLPILATDYPNITNEIIDENPPGLLLAGFLAAIIMLDLGWVLFGVATLRANVFPRLLALLVIVGAVLDFVVTFLDLPMGLNGLAGMVLIATVSWMGYTLWSGRLSTATAT